MSTARSSSPTLVEPILVILVLQLVLLILSNVVSVVRRVTALSRPVSCCACIWVFVLSSLICVMR
jgi:hypothetical protein